MTGTTVVSKAADKSNSVRAVTLPLSMPGMTLLYIPVYESYQSL